MSIKDVVGKIEKRFGKDAVSANDTEVRFVSTGSLGLDAALGGGFAVGRLVELISWESGGKTTVALHHCSEVQKTGKAVGYLDAENAMDLYYAKALGVDLSEEKWLMSQPTCAEDAIEILREMVRSGEFGLCVVDSVASLVPKAVQQGEAGDQKMGLLARLMATWIPTLLSDAVKNNCTILFINQYREKIGVMFGDNRTTPGGNSIKFYCSQRVEISRAGFEKDGDVVSANKTKAKIIKNKVYIPQLTASFNIVYGHGIDSSQEMIELGVDYGVIEKKGSWYNYGEIKLGQGAEKTKELIEDNPEMAGEIYEKIQKEISEEIKRKKQF